MYIYMMNTYAILGIYAAYISYYHGLAHIGLHQPKYKVNYWGSLSTFVHYLASVSIQKAIQ